LQGKLAEQGNADRELVQTALKETTRELGLSFDGLNRRVEERLSRPASSSRPASRPYRHHGERLDQISGKVSERLEDGFKKTNETFANVMARSRPSTKRRRRSTGLTSNVRQPAGIAP